MPRYTISISKNALKQLKRLPAKDQEKIVERIDDLQENLAGDVKRLTSFMPAYRLRVGNYRVLFDVEGTMVFIRLIGHRRDIYD